MKLYIETSGKEVLGVLSFFNISSYKNNILLLTTNDFGRTFLFCMSIHLQE